MSANARSLLIFLLLLIAALQVPGRERKSSRVSITSFEVAYKARAYIGRFERASSKDVHLYVTEMIERIARLQLHVRVTGAVSDRVFFEKQLDCCQLLNGIGNGIMRRFYSRFIVNSTFHCPFRPDRYFLRLEVSPDMMPALHPKGKFKIDISLSLPNETLVLQLLWKYLVK